MDISSVSQLAANSLLTSTGSSQGTSTSSTDGSQMFSDILSGLVDNVNTTDAAFQSDMVKAAQGELSNPHQLLIDSSKATVALQLASSVKNDALQAYNDIIRMSV